MREVDAAWAAGLFEGEGCITAQRRPGGGEFLRPLMSLQMTDADIVHRFHKIVGVGNVRIQEHSHKKQLWHWQTGAIDDVRHVIRLLAPWLGERRLARAQEYLLAYETAPMRRVSKTHCPHGHEFTPENTRIYDGSRRCITCHRTTNREAQRRYQAKTTGDSHARQRPHA
jgi:hypothetical protein